MNTLQHYLNLVGLDKYGFTYHVFDYKRLFLLNCIGERRNLPHEREGINTHNSSSRASRRRRRRPRSLRSSSTYIDTDNDRINITGGPTNTRSRSGNLRNNDNDCSTNYSTESADGDISENDIDHRICHDHNHEILDEFQ